MENYELTDTPEAYKKLLSLNKSLQARLDEYTNALKKRDIEIEMLRAMLSENTAYRSNLDLQVNELKLLHEDISHLKQHVNGTGHISIATEIDDDNRNGIDTETLQHRYTYLKVQIADLQKQVEQLSHRNLLLQHQASRATELESLLSDAAVAVDFNKNKETV